MGVASSVDASLHFPRTPLPTPSSLSLCNLSSVCPLASALLKQPLRFLLLPLPQPAAPSAGAVARGTSLPTRDEDHATLCDPLAVAAGQAVCASLAFSIAAPEPELTTHTYPPFRRPIQWRLSSNERLITSINEKQKKPKKKKKSAHPPN